MKPSLSSDGGSRGSPVSRRGALGILALGACFAGCVAPAVQGPQPDANDIADLGNEQTLVGDYASATGTQFIKLEAVALVTRLDGTGSDPPPSAQRAMLIADMQARGVRDPNGILASPSTSMVVLRAMLPPGCKKGDHFDVEVVLPHRSETTSLRGGWLMQARMEDVAILGGDVRRGRVQAHAKGPVLIDAITSGSSEGAQQVHGRIPGGAVSIYDRSFGLVLHRDGYTMRTSSQIGTAINLRFHLTERGGGKRGVATPKRDNYVQLEQHPRYRYNLARYLKVVSAISISEVPSDRASRLQFLGKQLLNPTTSATAAIKLEAIGQDARETLVRGLQAAETEIRFYSAEALGYLDDPRAVKPLADFAKNEPAFRWHALTALSGMTSLEDQSAYAALNELLHLPSAETRYGAFRALWAMNSNDSLVRGEWLNEEFSYHRVETTAEPMIHFSRTNRPEMVVFGGKQQLKSPFFAFAGKEIMVKGDENGRVQITRFATGEEDRREECRAGLDDIVHALARIGADYGDVIEFCLEAKKKEALEARVVIDAIPRFDRTYRQADGEATGGEGKPHREVASPPSQLFFPKEASDAENVRHAEPEEEAASEESKTSGETPATGGSWLPTIGSWFGS